MLNYSSFGEWQERIEKLGKLLNFSYSQKKFIEMLPEAKKIMKQ